MSFGQANCTDAPTTTATDAGVAGTGVLLSFIITAGLALILSMAIILHELRRGAQAKIMRKLLLSFSDQQILTGLGIQSVGLAKMQQMVPYHFFIIWLLSLLSTATHLTTLLVLVNDLKRDWILRWMRQFLMFVNLVLSCVYGIFILRIVMKAMAPTLPVACVWELPNGDAPKNAAISIVGTIAVMAGSCIVFALAVWYIHNRKQRFLKPIQIVSMLALTAMAVGAAVRVLMVSQAFGTPSVELADQGEKEWSFGQLLPVLLLLLPLVSATEIVRGEMNVPPPVNEDETPLVSSSEYQGHELFQPNPIWNRRK